MECYDDTVYALFLFYVLANAHGCYILMDLPIYSQRIPMSGSHRKENKRNNYAKNYMALLTPKQTLWTHLRCVSLFASR